MKLNDLMDKLRKLQDEGKGNLQVFARHGASGACYPLGSLHITSEVDDLGPFDLAKGEEYVSVYVGN